MPYGFLLPAGAILVGTASVGSFGAGIKKAAHFRKLLLNEIF